VRILMLLSQHFMKDSYRFSPEWGPDSLQKSIRISLSSHSLDIQCTVIPKNGMQLEEVHASSVKERRPGAF
jgi:hypothetical protein